MERATVYLNFYVNEKFNLTSVVFKIITRLFYVYGPVLEYFLHVVCVIYWFSFRFGTKNFLIFYDPLSASAQKRKEKRKTISILK